MQNELNQLNKEKVMFTKFEGKDHMNQGYKTTIYFGKEAILQNDESRLKQEEKLG